MLPLSPSTDRDRPTSGGGDSDRSGATREQPDKHQVTWLGNICLYPPGLFPPGIGQDIVGATLVATGR
jgi:hypothetical protein